MTVKLSVYLDYAATAKVRPEAVSAVVRALETAANPSSVHADGRHARALVEDARASVAKLANVSPEAVTFTSGGSEADGLAVESAALLDNIGGLIVSTGEHEAVLESAKAVRKPIEEWPLDANGAADLDWLADRLKRWSGPGRPFVALMLVNNATGVIQPVAEAAKLVREVDGWLHVDAVQAAGKIEIDLEALGADTLALSAHKIGGPQGAGALIAGPRARLTRRLHGGGQERGRRAGTENLSGIAGFAAAAEAALRDLPQIEARTAWRDRAAEQLKAAGAVVTGEQAPRVADILAVAVADWPSDLQVIALDLEGVRVSAGAACSSGKVKASRVLEAMGQGELAAGAMRASSGWATTAQDWDRLIEVWITAYGRQRARKLSAA